MTSFVLIPGAGGIAWYWHRVAPLLEAARHEAVPVDLPGDNPDAGLGDYADRVVAAIGARGDVVLVAQSLGGFTAPLVCERKPVNRLVFVNAMIPLPGERVGAWGEATGSGAARQEAAQRGGYPQDFDPQAYFLHDLPREVAEEAAAHERDQADEIFSQTCAFAVWPKIPIHVIVGADDRLFPPEFQRRVARERLNADVDELPGGHLIALANPRGLADQLLSYLAGSPPNLTAPCWKAAKAREDARVMNRRAHAGGRSLAPIKCYSRNSDCLTHGERMSVRASTWGHRFAPSYSFHL